MDRFNVTSVSRKLLDIAVGHHTRAALGDDTQPFVDVMAIGFADGDDDLLGQSTRGDLGGNAGGGFNIGIDMGRTVHRLIAFPLAGFHDEQESSPSVGCTLQRGYPDAAGTNAGHILTRAPRHPGARKNLRRLEAGQRCAPK